MNRSAYGYKWENWPRADWFETPATDAQLAALGKQRAWRSLSFYGWTAVLNALFAEAGVPLHKSVPITKGHASLAIDFYSNASPGSKRGAEKAVIEKTVGQARMDFE